MKAKPYVHGVTGEQLGHTFQCPGCGHRHALPTEGPQKWSFNGDLEKPTFSPSVLVTTGHYMPGHSGRCWCHFNAEHPEEKDPDFVCVICHSFVTDGKIQFLDDCTHHLKGQTVDLPDLE